MAQPELLRAFEVLGCAKTARKYLVTEDDEETAGRVITALGGVLHLMQTQFFAFYERTALLHEVERVCELFERSQTEMGKKGKPVEDQGEAVRAIVAMSREMARTIKDRQLKTMGGMAIIDTPVHEQQGVVMNIANVARALALPLAMAALDDTELLEAKRKNEPPARLVEMIVAALKKAYVPPTTPAITDVFKMHARAQARIAIDKIIARRGLKEPHVD